MSPKYLQHSTKLIKIIPNLHISNKYVKYYSILICIIKYLIINKHFLISIIHLTPYIINIQKIMPDSQPAHKQPINLAMVSDFYKPYTGGVQLHIQKLVTKMSQYVQKVIVITHKYEQYGQEYVGVNQDIDARVYYLNIPYNRNKMVIYPTYILNFPQIKRILEYQQINLVHCHQSSSTLAMQFMLYCQALNIKLILTEHSLVGFKHLSHFMFNKCTQMFFARCHRIIAVSKTLRNNIIVRSQVIPSIITVIPNGVENLEIVKKKRLDSQIRIVVVGRLAERRGTDLLIQALPFICEIDKNIRVWIIGNGPKFRVVAAQIEKHGLQNQAKLLGVKPHDQLLQTLAQCDIFLNTPYTQSFGIALAEAVQVGLLCISTNVGAIKQSFPPQCLLTVDLNCSSIVNGIRKSLKIMNKQMVIAKDEKNMTKLEYSWDNVTQRTLQVYKKTISEKPVRKIRYSNFLDYVGSFIIIVLTLMNFYYRISFTRNKQNKIPKTFNRGL